MLSGSFRVEPRLLNRNPCEVQLERLVQRHHLSLLIRQLPKRAHSLLYGYRLSVEETKPVDLILLLPGLLVLLTQPAQVVFLCQLTRVLPLTLQLETVGDFV